MISDNCCLNFFPFFGEHLGFVLTVVGASPAPAGSACSPRGARPALAPGAADGEGACPRVCPWPSQETYAFPVGFWVRLVFWKRHQCFVVSAAAGSGCAFWVVVAGVPSTARDPRNNPPLECMSGSMLSGMVWGCEVWGIF